MRISKLSTVYFFIFLGLLLFTFRSLLFHLGTNLPDWRDQALADWIINQNIDKITTFNFSHFFDTNAFYPHPYSILFSDLYLPQTIIDMPLLAITRSTIISFNLLFFLTFIFNYLSSFTLWKLLFKNTTVAFIGGLLISFSPFFHLEMSHLQMLTVWPFALSIYFLFKNKEAPSLKYIVLSGVFLAIQFLASVYLGIFLIATIFFFFLSQSILEKKIRLSLKNFLIIFLVFLVLDGIFIKGYQDMKKYYGAKRDLGEYVTYSAELSDYLFTKPINSLIHKSSLAAKWNSQDKNNGTMATFPGFTLFFLSILGIFALKIKSKTLSLSLNLDSTRLFFLFMIIFGFIFSLGPRFLFNGTYTSLIAPYALLLKTIPFIDAARVPMRWSLLVYLGLTFFSLTAIDMLYRKRILNLSMNKTFYVLTIAFVLLISAEYIPLNVQSEKKPYITTDYTILKDICSKKPQAVLELPVTHLDVYPNIVEGVTYISEVELSSTYHKCYLVNGYSGYDLPAIFTLRDKLNADLINNNSKGFIADLKNSKVNIIKINEGYLIKELRYPTAKMEQDILKINGVHKIQDSMYSIAD